MVKATFIMRPQYMVNLMMSQYDICESSSDSNSDDEMYTYTNLQSKPASTPSSSSNPRLLFDGSLVSTSASNVLIMEYSMKTI